MARSVVYSKAGSPADVLEVIAQDSPAGPDRGQVLVRVTAFPIHPGDLQAIEASGFPAGGSGRLAAGIEATGVVESVGPGVEVAGVEPGARVSVFPQPGAWSEFVLADAQFVVPVPENLSDDVAAQMLVNPLTVQMLRREVEATRAVAYNGVFLQTAAGSSVGRLMTAGSEHHAIGHINIVRSAEGADLLRKRFPNTPVVSTAQTGWQGEIRKLAGRRPITAAIDPVGGRLAAELLDLLAPGGTLISYGRIAEEPIPVHATKLLDNALTIRGTSVARWAAVTSPEQRAWDVQTALMMAHDLTAQFEPAARYDISDIAKAVEHAVRPGKVGTVLTTFS
jgi:NADPH:quinone reductase-like Zn-dependent oxidoreductase